MVVEGQKNKRFWFLPIMRCPHVNRQSPVFVILCPLKSQNGRTFLTDPADTYPDSLCFCNNLECHKPFQMCVRSNDWPSFWNHFYKRNLLQTMQLKWPMRFQWFSRVLIILFLWTSLKEVWWSWRFLNRNLQASSNWRGIGNCSH